VDASTTVVERDGTALAAVALGTAMPIDPGVHHVEVRARGFAPWSADVEIAGGERRELVVGPLVRLDTSSVETPVPPPTSSPVETERRGVDGERHGLSPRKIVGYSLGGTGIVMLGVGTVAGVLAITKSARSEELCAPRCNEEGYTLNGEAKTAADVSTVALVVGVVAASAGLYLLLAGPHDTKRALVPRAPLSIHF
jgi:hypothetical protein